MRTAALILAFVAALCLALAGCSQSGTTGQPGRPPGEDQVRLVVSRDFGRTILTDRVFEIREDTTVLALLQAHATVETGGPYNFVTAIDGLRSSTGGTGDGGSGGVDTEGEGTAGAAVTDWFYWVDGRLADVSADSWPLYGSETVWWDYHRWSNAMGVPWTVSAFPLPFSGFPQTIMTDGDADGLEEWATSRGLPVSGRSSLDVLPAGAAIVLVTPDELASIPWLATFLKAGLNLGVFITVEGGRLFALDEDGQKAEEIDAAAFAVAQPDAPRYPILLLVADSLAEAGPLLERLVQGRTTATIGLCLATGQVRSLPWPERAGVSAHNER